MTGLPEGEEMDTWKNTGSNSRLSNKFIVERFF